MPGGREVCTIDRYMPVADMIKVRARLEGALIKGLEQSGVLGQSKHDGGGLCGTPPNTLVARGSVYIAYVWLRFAGEFEVVEGA